MNTRTRCYLMHRLAGGVLGALLAGALQVHASPVQAPAWAEQQKASIRYWLSQRRADLALATVNKWLLSEPDNPQALLWKGRLELEWGDADLAQKIADKLNKQFGNGPEAQELATALRLAGKDRQAFAGLKYLVRSDKVKQNLPEIERLLQNLFPQGAPLGEAGIEYADLLMNLPGQTQRGLSVLEGLHQRFPQDSRYTAALIQKSPDNVLAKQGPRWLENLRTAQQASPEELQRLSGKVAQALKAEQTRVYLAERERQRQLLASAAASERAAQNAQGEAQQAERARAVAQAENLSRLAQEKRQAGLHGEALELLEAAVRTQPDNAWIRYDLARVYDDMGESLTAREVMSEGRDSQTEPDIWYASALLSSRQDRPAEALSYLMHVADTQRTPGMQRLQRQLDRDIALQDIRNGKADIGRLALLLDQSADADEALAVVNAYVRLDREAEGLAALQAWLSQHPEQGRTPKVAEQLDNLKAQVAIAQLNQSARDGHYNNAAAGLKTLPPEWLGRGDAQRLAKTLQERKQGRLDTAYMHDTKSGADGISALNTTEIPLYGRYALDHESHAFMHADWVSVSAGKLDSTDLRNAVDVGKVAALGLPTSTAFLDQTARGFILGVGYETDAIRLDLGAMPSEFAVGGWVGGVRRSFDIGATQFRFDLSRRPVTSSMLSYAGLKDPVTGQAWGGVKRNGMNLFTYRPFGKDWEWITDSTLAVRTGEHVDSNRELNLRTSVSTPVYKSRNNTVESGMSATYWSFDKNLRFYTFGQGGYYSPQSYLSVGVPVDWYGKGGEWAWRLRGNVGFTRTRENDSAYFPNDAALQSAAATFLAANNLAGPVYTGGTGGGISYSLTGHIEHTLLERLQVGARFQIDRSKSYAPNALMLYARWLLDNPAQVTTPPRAVLPYSRY